MRSPRFGCHGCAPTRHPSISSVRLQSEEVEVIRIPQPTLIIMFVCCIYSSYVENYLKYYAIVNEAPGSTNDFGDPGEVLFGRVDAANVPRQEEKRMSTVAAFPISDSWSTPAPYGRSRQTISNSPGFRGVSLFSSPLPGASLQKPVEIRFPRLSSGRLWPIRIPSAPGMRWC